MIFITQGFDYKTALAVMAQQVTKSIDYSQIMVAELASNWSLAYRQEPTDFVADLWFPQIGVDKIAGLYPRWAMENAFTNKAGTWRPGSTPPQGELKVDSPGFYACERTAFEMPLLADLPYVAAEGYDLEQATTYMVTDVLQLNKELTIANKYFKTGVWGTDWAGVNTGETGTEDQTTGLTFRRFNDADSDPLQVFKDAKLTVKKKCGKKPTMAIMGEQVYEEMRINEQLVSLFRNPQGVERVPTKLNVEMLCQALDLEKILVAGAMYNKAAPGATVDLDWIFGKGIWLGYVTTPGPLKTIAAMNLSFNEPLGGFDTAFAQVPDLHVKTTWYQGFQCWCPVVMAQGAGLYMDQVIP